MVGLASKKMAEQRKKQQRSEVNVRKFEEEEEDCRVRRVKQVRTILGRLSLPLPRDNEHSLAFLVICKRNSLGQEGSNVA